MMDRSQIDAKQIEIKYTTPDGQEHVAFVWPLVRKEGIKVIHTLIQAIGGAVAGGNITEMLSAIDYDVFISIASPLLRNATIDWKECKDVENFDGFNGRFLDLYVVVFEALKVNYPDFFALMTSGASKNTEAPEKEK